MVKKIAGRGWMYRRKLGIVLLSAVVLNVFGISAVNALTNSLVSPNPNNFTQEVTNSPLDYAHIIKKAGTSDITSLSMAAYFDTPSSAYRIQIADRELDDGRCGVTDPSNLPAFMRVTLTTNTTNAQKTVTYSVPSSKICSGSVTTDNPYGSNSANFFGYYQVPRGFINGQAQKDLATNLYKVNITIAYDSNVPLMPTSAEQQVLFHVKLADCGASACTRYLSTVPIGVNADRNYSTTGPTNQIGTGYAAERFGFGLPCTNGSISQRTVKLYDVDNGNPLWPRRASFTIERNTGGGTWVRVKSPEIISVAGATGYTPGNTTITPADGSNQTTTVVLNMFPYQNYRLIISPMFHTNLLGVGLPEETIFGDLNCNVSLDGSISVSPTTGINPIEVGRTVSFAGLSTRSGNTDFTSSYTSLLRAWYDTGDGLYQASESSATCAPPNAAVRSQTGSGTLPLGGCNDILADATKSGGNASAICVQLILTRLPQDGVTQIGTGSSTGPPLVRCVQIGKRPHLAALNGDILSGGVLDATPCTLTKSPIISANRLTIAGVNYSSYGSYGVTSLGVSRSFGSNGLKAGDATSAALVFSNRTENSVNGYFYNPNNSTAIPASGRCLTDPFSTLGAKATTSAGAPASVDLSSLATPGTTVARYYTTGGTLNVTASSDIPQGAKVIIYARSADVKINSNIRYNTGAYASVTQLPQVVVLTNKDLIVDDNVDQIDGIYAAKNDVCTCDSCSTAPRLNTCTKALAVNGTTIAGNLIRPYRTFGADRPDYGQPAETFSLRPDTLIGQLPAPNDPSVYVRTVSEREIPPRF